MKLGFLRTFALAGVLACMTACVPATTGTGPSPVTVADTAIAKQTAKIEATCRVLPTVYALFNIAVATGVVKSQRVVDTASAAFEGAAAICASPVQDVPTALAAVSRAYTAIISATPPPAASA